MRGYCFKCKAMRQMDKTREVTLKNRHRATRGVCARCGTKMFKLGKNK